MKIKGQQDDSDTDGFDQEVDWNQLGQCVEKTRDKILKPNHQ